MKGTTEHPGIIPQALKFLFDSFNQEKKVRGDPKKSAKKSISKRTAKISGRKSTAKKMKSI
jgi:hypothetical protein